MSGALVVEAATDGRAGDLVAAIMYATAARDTAAAVTTD